MCIRDSYECLWVVDFPLLEWDEETQRYYAMHHPFTAPKPEDQDRLESDPGSVRADAYDLSLIHIFKLEVADKYDVMINLKGGGFKGQSEAARLGIARALIKINPEDKATLRAAGFVTRDPRVVERKKPGRPKARKKFQFSKR